jgi:hypothetical protein
VRGVRASDGVSLVQRGKPAYRCRHGRTSAMASDLARPKNTLRPLDATGIEATRHWRSGRRQEIPSGTPDPALRHRWCPRRQLAAAWCCLACLIRRLQVMRPGLAAS